MAETPHFLTSINQEGKIRQEAELRHKTPGPTPVIYFICVGSEPLKIPQSLKSTPQSEHHYSYA